MGVFMFAVEFHTEGSRSFLINARNVLIFPKGARLPVTLYRLPDRPGFRDRMPLPGMRVHRAGPAVSR